MASSDNVLRGGLTEQARRSRGGLARCTESSAPAVPREILEPAERVPGVWTYGVTTRPRSSNSGSVASTSSGEFHRAEPPRKSVEILLCTRRRRDIADAIRCQRIERRGDAEAAPSSMPASMHADYRVLGECQLFYRAAMPESRSS